MNLHPARDATGRALSRVPGPGAITIALGVAAVSAQAQEKEKKGGQSPEQQIERIEQAVGTLTDDQKTKIKDIIAKGREEVQAIP